MNRKEQQIEALVAPTVSAVGCTLWGVEYLAAGKHSKLCIYIDKKPDGVTVDDCAAVSQQISELLDVEEVLTGAYTLEVSSPGLDRLLFHSAHYAEMAGSMVDIRLRYAFEGRKKFVGQLVGVENDEAIVRIDSEELVLPIEIINRARVVPQFAGAGSADSADSESLTGKST